MKYHVTCSNPGMHRGGRRNPAHSDYALGDHTPNQLRELLADPHTSVVIGEPMTEKHVVAMEAEAVKAAAKAAVTEVDPTKGTTKKA